MTKKLVDLFNLPTENINEAEETQEESILPEELPSDTLDAEEITTQALSNLEKIESALPQVRGLEMADRELDEIADLAINTYKDLQDLGMQVDSRFSSEIFAVGSTMLGHALSAKTAKINKKLKMIELQLKKAALDQKNEQKDKEIQATPLGEGKALDRNELLKMFANRANN